MTGIFVIRNVLDLQKELDYGSCLTAGSILKCPWAKIKKMILLPDKFLPGRRIIL
jgi:hypothetical protein